MSGTDRAITLAVVLLWNAPDGDVQLCDGGQVDFDPGGGVVRFAALDPVFGTVAEWPEITAQKGDLAESATIKFAPVPTATLADWWRGDLVGTRLRLWLGELDSDQLTMASGDRLADLLIATVGREQGADGSDLLVLDLTGRTERLFLTDEGNVCSDRFHQTVWAGELGFANCTDVGGKFAWGTADSSAEETAKGGKKKKKKKGGD
jgi:hypothetical protein